MFSQSQRTLNKMYERWTELSGPEKDMLGREIFNLLPFRDRKAIEGMTKGIGKKMGGGSYINLLLSLILHPTSREGLEGMWKEREIDKEV